MSAVTMHHAILGRSGCRSRTEWPENGGPGGMRDVLRAHCGRVVAWALHWWASHWSQVRVEVCLKAEKGPNSGFCVCGVPEMAIFARNSKWGTVLGGNLLWFHLDF